MKRLLVTCLSAALVMLVGCELAPPGSTPSGGSTEQANVTQEQQRLLEEIKKIQQQTGHNLQTLVQDAQQRAARERSEEGMPGVVEDIMAAQAVVGDATEAAQLEKASEAAAAISRLRGIVLGMLAERPASVVRRHCERALAYLHLSTPLLDEASAELTAAYDVTAAGPDAAGVQALLNQAKTHLADGGAQDASKVILTVIGKTGDEKSVTLISQMFAELNGAVAALDRQAWPVVQAELNEVRRMLDELAVQVRYRDEVAKIQPAPVAVATPTEPAAETGDATPTTEPATVSATEPSAVATPAVPVPAASDAVLPPAVTPAPAPTVAPQ